MVIPIILSGGVGSRLWPLSRKDKPKHLMPLIQELEELKKVDNALSVHNSDSLSLLQQTILRCKSNSITNSVNSKNIFTHNPIMVCDDEHRFLVLEQCKTLNIKPEDILIEPSRKDTAAAIILALLHVRKKYSEDALVLVTPADHYMTDLEYFINKLHQATDYANTGNIVTFGITPTYPETGYGYINADLSSDTTNDFYNVRRFIEKPKVQVAERLIAEQDCFWNSGMFLFKVGKIIEICAQHQPELLKLCEKTIETSYKEHEFIKFDAAEFNKIDPLSIDYAIMQDATNMMVGKYDGQWADVGCWHGVWKNSLKDLNNNAVIGDVIYDEDVNNCYLRAESRLLVAADVENLTVIETPDAILVTKLDNSKNLRAIVERSLSQQKSEFVQHSHVHRPWGDYVVLCGEGEYKIKKLVIKPGHATSLQTHEHRCEHWIVLQGQAEVIRDTENLSLSVNDTIKIPVNTKHRISNPSKTENLVIIEVQIGDYLSEDDIIRYKDNYGRVK